MKLAKIRLQRRLERTLACLTCSDLIQAHQQQHVWLEREEPSTCIRENIGKILYNFSLKENNFQRHGKFKGQLCLNGWRSLEGDSNQVNPS